MISQQKSKDIKSLIKFGVVMFFVAEFGGAIASYLIFHL